MGSARPRRLALPASLPHQSGMSPVELASLLCSRLCHDLMSPVGALSNGIELLQDETDPEMRERCIELLAESARASANKLKFFRLAFGAGGGFGEMVEVREARAALEGIFGPERRVALNWLASDEKLSKSGLKLLLNLALIAGDALVRGGQLDIGWESGPDSLELVIRAEGSRVLLDEGIHRTLEGGSIGELQARSAGAWLARALVEEAGGTLRVSKPSPEVLVIGAVIATAASSAGQAATTTVGQG